MAIVVKDRVKETAVSPGTGTITLAGAASGFQSFNAVGDGNITYFAIVDSASGDWEVNYGEYASAGTTLTRNATPLSSSNSGNLVNFTGTVDVFCTYPSEKAIYEEVTGNVLIDGGPITVVGEDVSPGYTTFGAALAEMYGNVDSFAQSYARNLNTGQEASADMIVYRDNTVADTANFLDMGINSQYFDSDTWPIFTQGSMYLYGNGGELFIGSETDDVIFFAGGVDPGDEVARFSHTTGELTTRESINVTGDVNAVGGTFTAPVTTSSVTTPTNDEFVTKAYVDGVTANGFHVHTAVQVATTGNLTATYSNGTSGVGATLTNSGAQAALEVDGVSVLVNDRVLVWQQTSGAQNGVYVVTTVGDGSTNWVLTRSSDTDTYSEGDPNSLGGGDYFFVESGATLGSSSYVCTNDGTITFGTTDITFSLFSSVPAYNVVAPLDLTGNTLSLAGTVAATHGGTGYSSYTVGQVLYADTTTTLAKLNIGTTYNVLTSSAGGVPSWSTVNLASSDAVSGTLGATNGGTSQNSYATGDTLYASASNTLSKLSGNTSTTKKFMVQTGTGSASAAPVWDVVNGSDVNGNISGSAGSVANALTAGTYLTGSSFDGSVARTWTVDATSANTASKVVARDSSGDFSAGTITAALSGNATTATTATNVAGGAANKLVYNASSGTTAFADAPSASGQVLGWNGSAFAWTTTIATATTATSATTATNLAGGAASQIPYQTGSGATSFIANGTSGQVLTSNGSSAPSWQTSTAASKSYVQAMSILRGL